MLGALAGVGTAVVSIVGDWIKGKQTLQAAEIEHAATDAGARREMSDRFSRRFVLVVLSAPIIIGWFDVDQMRAIFAAMAEVPQWWAAGFGSVVAASWGRKAIPGFIGDMRGAWARGKVVERKGDSNG